MLVLHKSLCKIADNKMYVHKPSGEAYVVIGIVQMKNPVSKRWAKAVLYRKYAEQELYVRDLKDFRVKFEQLKEYKKNNDKK